MGKVHQVVACFGGTLCLSHALFVRHLLCCWLITYSWSLTFEPSLAPFESTIFLGRLCRIVILLVRFSASGLWGGGDHSELPRSVDERPRINTDLRLLEPHPRAKFWVKSGFLDSFQLFITRESCQNTWTPIVVFRVYSATQYLSTGPPVPYSPCWKKTSADNSRYFRIFYLSKVTP